MSPLIGISNFTLRRTNIERWRGRATSIPLSGGNVLVGRTLRMLINHASNSLQRIFLTHVSQGQLFSPYQADNNSTTVISILSCIPSIPSLLGIIALTLTIIAAPSQTNSHTSTDIRKQIIGIILKRHNPGIHMSGAE